MARKGQNIKVVVHMPEDMCSVFNSERAETFWEDMAEKRLSSVSEELRNQLWLRIVKKHEQRHNQI